MASTAQVLKVLDVTNATGCLQRQRGILRHDAFVQFKIGPCHRTIATDVGAQYMHEPRTPKIVNALEQGHGTGLSPAVSRDHGFVNFIELYVESED